MPNLDTAGALLHYVRTGHGPPVLLIQGVGAIGNAWRPQIEALGDRYTLVSFDNRGIGRSTIRDGRFTIEAMANDALAIMDVEGVDRFHVAGHSMGGVIAQALALSAPARVKSLAFLCTFARGKDGSSITLPMLGTAMRMRIGTRAQRRNAFLELIMPERYLQQVDRARLAAELQPLFGHDLADQPPIVMKQLKAMSRFDAGARLKELATIPTLVVSAVEDRIAGRSTGRALATAIPGSRYVEIADAGHGLPIHRAAETNALLDEHWSRAEGLLPPIT
jgi:pimeloyl-ACP methyl ester carboxylesterase